MSVSVCVCVFVRVRVCLCLHKLCCDDDGWCDTIRCLIWAAVCTIITNCYEEQVYDDEGDVVVVVSTTSSSDDDVTCMNECMRTYVCVYVLYWLVGKPFHNFLLVIKTKVEDLFVGAWESENCCTTICWYV